MSNLKGILRGGYYNYLYFKKLNKLNINRNQIIILATIAKSGTHYFKFLLSNYINLMSDRDAKPMTPNEVNNFFLTYGINVILVILRSFKVPQKNR